MFALLSGVMPSLAELLPVPEEAAWLLVFVLMLL